MKTLTNLTAKAADSKFEHAPGHRHSIGEQPVIGYARAAQFGQAGVVFTNGNYSVAIPIEELWALAEKHEPGLKPPAPDAPIKAKA